LLKVTTVMEAARLKILKKGGRRKVGKKVGDH